MSNLDTFRQISVLTSMEIPHWQSGHTGSASMPCTVYGSYNEKTGTLLFDSVWCNGNLFEPRDLDKSTIDKFMALLKEVIADSLF